MCAADSDDLGHARIAKALFDQVAEWNGFGRSLYAWSCGTHAEDTKHPPERAVSLMLRAESLGAPAKTFSRAPEQLAMLDLYTYDVVVAMDEKVMAECRHIFDEHLSRDWDSANDRQYYTQRCVWHWSRVLCDVEDDQPAAAPLQMLDAVQHTSTLHSMSSTVRTPCKHVMRAHCSRHVLVMCLRGVDLEIFSGALQAVLLVRLLTVCKR